MTETVYLKLQMDLGLWRWLFTEAYAREIDPERYLLDLVELAREDQRRLQDAYDGNVDGIRDKLDAAMSGPPVERERPRRRDVELGSPAEAGQPFGSEGEDDAAVQPG